MNSDFIGLSSSKSEGLNVYCFRHCVSLCCSCT